MTDKQLQKALDSSALFAGLTEEERESLVEIARLKWLPKQSLLFSEGEAAKGFFVVVSGKVKVFKVSQEGKEQILHIFGRGEPVGEVPVFSGIDYPANACTLKESRILYIPRSRFLDLAERRPQILLNMLATLSKRLRQFTLQIERLSLKEVASRLAGVILEMADESGSAERDVVVLPGTKGQLANQIGTTPETLSRTLQRLTRQGLIKVDKTRLSLLHRKGLEELASGGSQLET